MPELPLEKSGFCSHPPGPDNTGLLQADLAPQPCQDLQNKHCPVSFYKLKGRLQVSSELYLFFLHFLSIFLLFLSPFIVKTQEHREIPLSKMYPLDKKVHSSVKCTEICCPRHRFKLCLHKMLVSPCTIQFSVKSCKDWLSYECFRKLKSRRKTVAAKCG